MIDIKQICEDSFQEWMDAPKETNSKEDGRAHVEILLKNYHAALKAELAKQGIDI